MSTLYKDFQKNAIKKALSLDKYISIREIVDKNDIEEISNIDGFQKTFNYFFKVRKDDEWRKKFYNYFKDVVHNKDITFKEILLHISYEKNIETSFSSKMLASINPEMPIWDKYVKKYFNIVVNRNDLNYGIDYMVKKYEELIEKVKEELAKPEIKEAIDEFKKEFGEYNLTDVKILDFIIWSNRSGDENEKN